MDSHHHCQCHQTHHHNQPPTTTIAACYYCCAAATATATATTTTCCTQSPNPPPPDPLLHSTIPSPYHHHHSPPLLPHHLYPPHPNQPYYNSPQNLYNQQNRIHHQQQHDEQTQSIIFSLLRRIAALESSIRHRQVSANSAPYSLRDAAAKTIQTHFRAFLVRRSRTLRQLKELTFIKSTLNTLKKSLSDNTHLDSQALSLKAMDLLLKLDSTQGFDSMIRDGKKSISRELIGFLEIIDGVSVKRSQLSRKTLKNVRFANNGNKIRAFHNEPKVGTFDCGDLGGDKRKLIEELRGRVEKLHGFSSRVSEDDENSGFPKNRIGGLVKSHGGAHSKVKKSVSFAEDGNVSRVFSGGDINGSDGSGSVDDERELIDNLCREVEEIGAFTKDGEDDEEEEGHVEDDGDSPQISDGERNPRMSLRDEGYEISGHFEGQNGKFVFSAPLPVKMESKADLMKKRKAVIKL